MKAYRLNMPGLTRAEQFARAADLQVAHGNRIARAELRVLSNHFQPLLSFESRAQLIVTEKVGVCPSRATSDTTAQLIELRQIRTCRRGPR